MSLLDKAMDIIDEALEAERTLSPEELGEIRELIDAGQVSLLNEIESLY